jgi:hypothetical protein
MNKAQILADSIQGILLASMPVEIKASEVDIALAKIMLAIKKAESISEFSALDGYPSLPPKDRTANTDNQIFASPSFLRGGGELKKQSPTLPRCYAFPCQSGYCKTMGLPCGKEVTNV